MEGALGGTIGGAEKEVEVTRGRGRARRGANKFSSFSSCYNTLIPGPPGKKKQPRDKGGGVYHAYFSLTSRRGAQGRRGT